jgi:hypothetical protein
MAGGVWSSPSSSPSAVSPATSPVALIQPRREHQRLRMVSPCARHDRCDLEGGLNRAQHAASDTAERHRQFETLDSPGFFYLWCVNVRRGSISGLQCPLSGRYSPGSGGSALGHTSITRSAAGIRN